MAKGTHPKLPHFVDSRLYAEDFMLMGLNRLQILKRDGSLLWEFKFTNDKWKWEVVFDCYEEHHAGEVVRIGEILKTFNFGLVKHHFKTVFVKLYVTDFPERYVHIAIPREFLYQVNVHGRQCYDLLPLCDDMGISDLTLLMPNNTKRIRGGIHRGTKAKIPLSRR